MLAVLVCQCAAQIKGFDSAAHKLRKHMLRLHHLQNRNKAMTVTLKKYNVNLLGRFEEHSSETRHKYMLKMKKLEKDFLEKLVNFNKQDDETKQKQIKDIRASIEIMKKHRKRKLRRRRANQYRLERVRNEKMHIRRKKIEQQAAELLREILKQRKNAANKVDLNNNKSKDGRPIDSREPYTDDSDDEVDISQLKSSQAKFLSKCFQSLRSNFESNSKKSAEEWEVDQQNGSLDSERSCDRLDTRLGFGENGCFRLIQKNQKEISKSFAFMFSSQGAIDFESSKKQFWRKMDDLKETIQDRCKGGDLKEVNPECYQALYGDIVNLSAELQKQQEQLKEKKKEVSPSINYLKILGHVSTLTEADHWSKALANCSGKF